MNKRYYWLKLPEDFFDRPAIRRLDNDTVVIYLRLLLAALNAEDGRIAYQGVDENLTQEILFDTRLRERGVSEETLAAAIARCARLGLIAINDEAICLTDLADMVGCETKKTRDRRRQRVQQTDEKDDEMSPVNGQMSPTGGQMSPLNGQMSPTGGQMSPSDGQMSPTSSQMSPLRGQMSHRDREEIDKETEVEVDKTGRAGGAQAGLPLPSLDEVVAYGKKTGSTVDAHKFYQTNEARGWRVSGNPVVNWQALFDTWSRTQRAPADESFSQHDVDALVANIQAGIAS